MPSPSQIGTVGIIELAGMLPSLKEENENTLQFLAWEIP